MRILLFMGALLWCTLSLPNTGDPDPDNDLKIGAITGKVVDQNSGQPVSFADILFKKFLKIVR